MDNESVRERNETTRFFFKAHILLYSEWAKNGRVPSSSSLRPHEMIYNIIL